MKEKQTIYYYSPQVTFREVPDEISLTIPTLCYKHCSLDCNSKFCWVENWEGEKDELTQDVLRDLINKNKGITCITIMTSLNYESLEKLFFSIKVRSDYPYRTALYIGEDVDEKFFEKYKRLINVLDYIKVGAFKKEFGPLDNPNTNQRFYKINHLYGKNVIEDITYKFYKKQL